MLTVRSPFSCYTSFCEEDYAVTIYVAEFINTISSLTYCKCLDSSAALLQGIHAVTQI
jgi:hypothetical protein